MKSPAYRIARTGQRQRLVMQIAEVEGPEPRQPILAHDLRVFRARTGITAAGEKIGGGSIVLLTDDAARYLLAAGSITEIELEDLPPRKARRDDSAVPDARP